MLKDTYLEMFKADPLDLTGLTSVEQTQWLNHIVTAL